MQLPISAGTVLQNRYRVLSILGQGGFGRTYLAEDQGRFNERCALKEFIAPHGSDYALSKSKELFQREAAILYQISHPQIPQFRATFEENARLFLVQDYVDGKTYRTLLSDRRAQGRAFSEAEVLQLILNLLPVLAHIHSKGIIHRDIAPDNIILRQTDGLPVLIDFGVVKEIVTRVQALEQAAETVSPTTVGKLGYAPIEQMQTGRAYPSSDLYALAVTSVVLLTGREPQDLFDDRTLAWNWQPWAKVSPGLVQIINRMLSYRPGDRYQSAAEVAQALQTFANPATVIQPSTLSTPPPQSSPPSPPSVPTPPTYRPTQPATPTPPPAPNVSQVRTIAVGRPLEPTTNYQTSNYQTAAPQPNRGGRAIPQPVGSSAWENPLALIGMGLALATVTGIAAWAIVSAVLNSSQPPQPSPTIAPTATASPTATPTPSPTPVEYSQRIELPATGETRVLEGNLKANDVATYLFPAEQGQALTAALEGEGMLLSVLAPDRQPADDRADRVLSWQGSLPVSGEYAVQLSPVQGVAQSNFKLNLSLQPVPAPEPSPSPSPSPSPVEPTIETIPVNPTVGTPLTLSDRASEAVIKRYVVEVQPGQVLSAAVVDGIAVTLNIRYPNGQPIPDAERIVNWQGRITEAGAYQVDVLSPTATSFTVSITISDPDLPPDGSQPPSP
ncbi:serine/threonine-protein kinase [Leptolyngbya sp. FACHB-711]|uniref:serine/threonine-protein kinase n=1 Tax=unclassified Leptolyngbya TaxID=2650499 RepID=UPI001686298F|nr:serine/threonine-protein kinase [Leptolyngbya sp. FACHB-711]MBD2024290.1 serine/threonine protein kinase [Leptolyngbya sp. FACHB-711]